MLKRFKSYRSYFFVTLALIVSMFTFFVINSSSTYPYTVKASEQERNVYYASTLSYVSKCGDIFGYKEVENISRMVPEGYSDNIPSAPTIIPMYGYVAQSYLPVSEVGFYSPETVNRSWSESYILSTMYHLGIPVIWYDEKQVTPAELTTLSTIAADFENQILILPWLRYENMDMPAERHFAYARFGSSQSCNDFNFNVFIDFLSLMKKEGITRKWDKLENGTTQDGILVELDKYSDK